MMIATIVLATLLGTPCVQVSGADPLAAQVRQALVARGVSAGACAAWVARVARGDNGVAVSLGTGERRIERSVTDAAMAAIVIEQWVRRDLVSGLLAPPGPEPEASPRSRALREPRVLRVEKTDLAPPPGEARAIALAPPQVATTAPVELTPAILVEPPPAAIAAPIAQPTPTPTPALAQETPLAQPLLAPEPLVADRAAPLSFAVSGELGLDDNGLPWLGARARGARALGPLELAIGLRFGAQRADSTSFSPTDRTIGELLLGLRLPVALGPLALTPSLSIGPHLAIASRKARDLRPIIRDGLTITDVTPAAELALSAAFPLGSGFAIDAESLLAWCRERLAGYKLPREIRVVEALPRGATGKLLRRAV